MAPTKEQEFDMNIRVLKHYINLFSDIASEEATEEGLEAVVHVLFCVVRQIRYAEVTLARFKSDEKEYPKRQRELEEGTDSVSAHIRRFLLPRLKKLELVIIEREKEKRETTYDYENHPFARVLETYPLMLERDLLAIITSYEFYVDKNKYKGQFDNLKKILINRLRNEKSPGLQKALDAVE